MQARRSPSHGALASAFALALLALACAVGLSTDRVRAEGASSSDGTRTLSISEAQLGLDGGTISVSGSGYDVEKGIYVSFCVIPPSGEVPSPCGGSMSDEGGAAHWISSNPPPYGVGLAIPYGPGGTFDVQLSVTTTIGAGSDAVDCTITPCAVATRNDHTRSSDRSQDVFVAVSFGAVEPPTATHTAVPSPRPANPTATPRAEDEEPAPTAAAPGAPTPVPAAPTAVIQPSAVPGGAAVSPTSQGVIPPPSNAQSVQPSVAGAGRAPLAAVLTNNAPAAILSDGGRIASFNGTSLKASKVKALKADGQVVTVTGSGFDESQGVFLALCAVSADGAAPKTCSAGDQTSAWISSSPPAYAGELAKPYTNNGSFVVELKVKPNIDASTDCRRVACAIVTRSDDAASTSRAQELALPVTFSSETAGRVSGSASSPANAPVTDDASDGSDDGSTANLWLIGPLVVLLVAGAAGGAVMLYRRRQQIN